MSRRSIIRIDEKKCDGCGACATACAEGAIAMVNGKARLVSETYCDGLGACLGHCPQGAITIEEREAEQFSEAAVHAHLAGAQTQDCSKKLSGATGSAAAVCGLASAGPNALAKAAQTTGRLEPVAPFLKQPRPQTAAPHTHAAGHAGCPGSMSQTLHPRQGTPPALDPATSFSQLGNWPVQLRLVSPEAAWLAGADILLAADCVPFAYADFHARFLRGKPVIVACPKLDPPEQNLAKLTEILIQAAPRSLTVIHMEVPCCGGLTRIAQLAAERARAETGTNVTIKDITIGIRGQVCCEVDLATL